MKTIRNAELIIGIKCFGPDCNAFLPRPPDAEVVEDWIKTNPVCAFLQVHAFPEGGHAYCDFLLAGMPRWIEDDC